MTTVQAVGEVLDETIKALASADLESLLVQEERIAMLAQSDLIVDKNNVDKNKVDENSMSSLLLKKHVLELLLHGSASNLNALNRLYGRNTRDPWEH